MVRQLARDVDMSEEAELQRLETVKGRYGAVGMWGDYCEREGHGEFVK